MKEIKEFYKYLPTRSEKATVAITLALLLSLLVTAAVLAVSTFDQTTTWKVTPQLKTFPGDRACPDGTYLVPDQFQHLSADGSMTYTLDGKSVTVEIDYIDQGVFNFEVIGGTMAQLFVKSKEYLLYQYEPYLDDGIATNTQGAVTYDTGVHANTNPSGNKYQGVSHLDFCLIPGVFEPPTATKTANTSYTRTYDWDITKDYDGTYTGFIGDPAFDHDYLVNVNQTVTDTDFAVSGIITVTNTNDFAVDVTVSDSVGGTAAIVNCGDGPDDDSLTVPANDSAACSYSADLGDELPADGTNVATISWSDPEVGQTIAQAPYVFGDPTTTVGDETVTVTDDIYGLLGTASGDATFDYSGEFQCSADPADYTNGVAVQQVVINTATIDETGDSDTATVTLDCYAPVPSKTAETSYTRTYTWDITKDFDGAYTGFIGDPSFNHGYRVTVDRTETDSDFAVSGTITIFNPHPTDAMDVTVFDTVNLTTATVDCGDGAGDMTLTVPASGSASCSYSADLGDTLPDDGINYATVKFNSIDFNATALYAFGDPTNIKGYETVDVTDTNGLSWEDVSGDTTWTYTRPFQCSADKADYTNGVAARQTVVNTATIVETGQSDDATVTLDCYAPTIAKTAAGTYDLIIEWTLEKYVNAFGQKLETYVGGPGSIFPTDWLIYVTKTETEENHDVVGTITVGNPNPDDNLVVSLVDTVNGTAATITGCSCGDYVDGMLTVPAGYTADCNYTANDVGSQLSNNTATITLNSIDFSASVPITWTETLIGDESGTLTDDRFAGFSETVTDDASFTLKEDFVCPPEGSELYVDGVYEYTVVNTAFLNRNIGLYDSASITVVCEAPQKPSIQIEDVIITEAAKKPGSYAKGTFVIKNMSGGDGTDVTLGKVWIEFFSVQPGGVRTEHTANCVISPVATGYVLDPHEAKQFSFDCDSFNPELAGNAQELTAIVYVDGATNQIGEYRDMLWSATSPPYKFQ